MKNNQNNEKSVHNLRKQGFKVRVIISRNVNLNAQSNSEMQLIPYKEFKNSKTIDRSRLGKGGSVQVEITTPDNKEKRGAANCYFKDGFNRKLGLKIAINRALHVPKVKKQAV